MSLIKDRKLIIVARTLCRELRKNSTEAEELFWEVVRNNRACGRKFYRQHPLYFDFLGKETFYIADFYCFSEKLVIEIDGIIHDYQKERDALRTHIINSMGIRVIRFKNNEVKEDINKVRNELITYFEDFSLF